MNLPLNKQERQFYHLFKRLENQVDNRDELGRIVGYSLVLSILDYETHTSKRRARKEEVISAAHEGLEKTIDECVQSGSYDTLLSLIKSVESYLGTTERDDPENTEKSRKSRLARIKKSLFSPTGGFYGDQFRKKGLRLVDKVYAKGPLTKKRDIIDRDLYLFVESFAEKGGIL